MYAFDIHTYSILRFHWVYLLLNFGLYLHTSKEKKKEPFAAYLQYKCFEFYWRFKSWWRGVGLYFQRLCVPCGWLPVVATDRKLFLEVRVAGIVRPEDAAREVADEVIQVLPVETGCICCANSVRRQWWWAGTWQGGCQASFEASSPRGWWSIKDAK